MKEVDYTSYVKAFTRLFEAYDAAVPYIETTDDFQYYVNRKRSWLERLKSPEFPVAFLGAFSAGKSTIINAVLGEDILPEATKSFTAIPTLIRKGRSNRAVIHYLDLPSRIELKNLYTGELAKELRKQSDDYEALDNAELLVRLEKDIEQHKNQLGSFSKQKFFDELKILVSGWNKLIGAVKEIEISQLPQFVTEDYEDVLFVDQAEVFLAQVNIPENVVLVDLPGLGVVNPRHRKVTKSYVENDAKAFVIAMKVFHLLEGEEIELLAEIHSQRKRVLQRAFWAINQWDVLSSQQKKEELANFNQKIEHYGFQIAKDRVFRVSALNYLLLRLIQDGRLDQSQNLKEHVDTLRKAMGKIPERPAEAEAALKSLEEAKNFNTFKTGLFDYLSQTARTEFLEEARAEYLELAKRLREKLEPWYENYKNINDDSLKNTFIAGELSRRQDTVLRELRLTVEEHIKILRTEILPELTFWREQDQKQLANQIARTIDNLDRKSLKNELLKGLDLNSVISRLPHKIEENLNIQLTFREQLQKALDDQIIKPHLYRLLDSITAFEALPDETITLVRDRLSGRDLFNRLKGMCDVFLFEYGEVIDDLGRTIMTREETERQNSPEEIVQCIRQNSDLGLEVAKRLNLLGTDSTAKDMLALGIEKLTDIYLDLADTQQLLMHPETRNNEIDRALECYRAGLLDYTRKQHRQINCYARRGIKNYFEELESDLLNYFESNKCEVAKVIMKQLTQDIDSELSAELEKQRIIKESFQTVNNALTRGKRTMDSEAAILIKQTTSRSTESSGS
ncbi:MAG: dynamin family protein [Methylococcaceae bacterium]